MSKPGLTQRTVRGWQIQWVAGLFCLLMVTAGAIPVYAAQFEPETDSKTGEFLATDQHEHVEQPGHDWSYGEVLSAGKTTWESEVESEETDASLASGAVDPSCFHEFVCAELREDRCPRSIDVSTRLFSRAPPRA